MKNHLFHQPGCELDLLVSNFEVDCCVSNARIVLSFDEKLTDRKRRCVSVTCNEDGASESDEIVTRNEQRVLRGG